MVAPSSDGDLLATLKFLDWQPLYAREKPFQIFIDIPPSAPDQRHSNLVFKSVQVPLRDVRSIIPPPCFNGDDGGDGDDGHHGGNGNFFSLDANGFVYRKHESRAVAGIISGDDDDALGAEVAAAVKQREVIEKEYLPEVEGLLRGEMEGVDEVFFFDWRLRKNAPDVEGSLLDLNDKAAWLRPATHVHIDQSPAAALNRIRSQLNSTAERLLKGRVRIVNVWRPLIRHVEDWPLAVCDGATVRRSDLVETDHVRRHYNGSTMYLQHHPEQRWYYMSKQGKDDVLIFKQFDSEKNVAGQFAPHGSFMHPNQPVGVEPRASIEVRAMVFTYAK